MNVRSSTRPTSEGCESERDSSSFLRVEADEGSGVHHHLAKPIIFLLSSVVPHDLVGPAQCRHLVNPGAQLGIGGRTGYDSIHCFLSIDFAHAAQVSSDQRLSLCVEKGAVSKSEMGAKALHPLGVDDMNIEPAIEERLDDAPCGTSIATWISSGLPPLVAMSQLHICASPSPLCSKVLLPSRLPLASASQTSCFWDAQSTPANHLGVLSISSLPLLLRATHDIGRPLYWRSKARSCHWASCHGHLPGRSSPTGAHRRKRGAGMSRQLPAGRLGLQRLRRFARLAQRASLRYAPRRVLRDTASTNRAMTVQGFAVSLIPFRK